LKQGGVRSLFDQVSLLQYENLIHRLQPCQAMGDEQGGPAVRRLAPIWLIHTHPPTGAQLLSNLFAHDLTAVDPADERELVGARREL
jgi:hypothetical protein